jgi:hypothetical protein
MKRILPALLAMLTLMPSMLYAVQPDEIMADPAQEASAQPVARTALHGLSEPVDRRFRRAAGARSAFSCASGSRRAIPISR